MNLQSTIEEKMPQFFPQELFRPQKSYTNRQQPVQNRNTQINYSHNNNTTTKRFNMGFRYTINRK